MSINDITFKYISILIFSIVHYLVYWQYEKQILTNKIDECVSQLES